MPNKNNPTRTFDPFAIRALAFDAFGTTCRGTSRGLLSWHRSLPAAERRRLRRAWMRGEIGLRELRTYGDSQAAPPLEVIERQVQDAAITLFDDVARVLTELQRRGYPMITISNVAAVSGDKLRRCLDPWMRGYVFSFEIGACKPDQALFHAAAKQVGVPTSRILMIGDSRRADIVGAAAVNMPAVRVDRRSCTAGSLSNLEPLLDWLPGPDTAIGQQ